MSVAIVFAGTFEVPDKFARILTALEAFASITFTIEYALRIATADFLYPEIGVVGSRVRYVLSPMAIVDLVAILPFWLPMFLPETMLGLRALRLVRLLRIFKLNRYYDAMKSIGDVIVMKKRELLGSLFFVAILMLLSSLLMYSAEHDAQPNVFRNAFSGLWWAVATLTTVGYGDIYPVTTVGRFLGALIAFAGIAAVAVPTGIITSGLGERRTRGRTVKGSASYETDKEGDARLLRELNEKVERLIEALSEKNSC